MYVPFSRNRDMKMKYGMRNTTGGAISSPMYQSMICFLPGIRNRDSAYAAGSAKGIFSSVAPPATMMLFSSCRAFVPGLTRV